MQIKLFFAIEKYIWDAVDCYRCKYSLLELKRDETIIKNTEYRKKQILGYVTQMANAATDEYSLEWWNIPAFDISSLSRKGDQNNFLF